MSGDPVTRTTIIGPSILIEVFIAIHGPNVVNNMEKRGMNYLFGPIGTRHITKWEEKYLELELNGASHVSEVWRASSNNMERN